MKQFFTITVAVFLIFNVSHAQDKEAYTLFTKSGKKVNYKKLLKAADKSNIILFGELHNNPIAHWLQLELTHDLSNNHRLTLGAEMFESKDQETINNYLQGKLDEKALDTIAKLWPNYKTDYAPLLNIAKDSGFAFIATNIPRNFANLVYRGGFKVLDTLSAKQKGWIAPLPIAYNPELSCYKNIFAMTQGHGNKNLPKAQAIKDATMSFFISENFTLQNLFIHYNGAYHSDNYQGILWYLKQWNPDIQYLTISTVEQTDVDKLNKQNEGIADFIICVDENMTKTY